MAWTEENLAGTAAERLAAHKDKGKSRVQDLDPVFLQEMGDVMAQGLTKYPNDPDGMPNWWKGGSYRGFVASTLRHALALAAGEDIDPESGQPHAAHIAVDASFIRSWQRRGVGVDDRLHNQRHPGNPAATDIPTAIPPTAEDLERYSKLMAEDERLHRSHRPSPQVFGGHAHGQ